MVLDGLAIMPVMIAAGTLGVIAYAVGRVDFTEYLDVHYVPGTGEILIFAAGVFGGGVGASFGTMRHLLQSSWAIQVLLRLAEPLVRSQLRQKHELVLGIVGGLFVVEAMSVIIQVLYFKKTGKRVFLDGPDPSPL